ncbi:MAG TPA: aminotransferase class III-fold pyridoxal phosphate-dependent enzyme, partial [Bacteroidota bacterium]|nr:aminotransferase class III-fold pyridoxal phosphate-dependent enzyme [Bacteroidota bacterium]
AVAAIDEMHRLGLVERASGMGAYLGDRLRALMNDHPSVGDVRGLGLFWALDLVRDRERREPFNTMADKVAGRPMVVDRVAADLMDRGVFLQPWVSHLVIAPPLIITREEIDTAVEALDASLDIADREIAAPRVS